ncbi:ATP-binding protein [Microcoleus sp. ARI1-B5]|uniref:ATP-binding protein n=2 Tax=unclassified Microcoleus TaxID=2642155 RepID=UPI002FD06A9A
MTKDSNQMTDNMDELPSGGIGIKVLGKIADELSYTPTSDSRNCLFLMKHYQPQDSTQASGVKRPIDVLNKWFQKQRDTESEASSNQPIQKISLTSNSDIKAVAKVLSWVDQLEELPIPEAVFHQWRLATIEGFTNAVRHAHKDLPLATPIELEITVFPARLEIKIWDYGKPFDLEAKLQGELAETSPFSWNELGFTLR